MVRFFVVFLAAVFFRRRVTRFFVVFLAAVFLRRRVAIKTFLLFINLTYLFSTYNILQKTVTELNYIIGDTGMLYNNPLQKLVDNKKLTNTF